MATTDTTVYISVDDLRAASQNTPLPEQFDDRDLLEAFVAATLDFSLSDGFDTAGSVSEMSTEVLKARALNVLLAAQNSPDYRASLMNGARLNEISSDWRLRAANSSTGSGSAAAAFYAQAADEELSTARTLVQTATTKEELLLGAVKYGSAAGKIFGFLGTILSVGEGLYTGVADDTFKGIFSTLVSGIVVYIVSAAVGLSLLAGWEFVAAAAIVAVIGYSASKVGDVLWNAFVGDIVWDTLDSMGVGDGVREAFSEASKLIFGSENAVGDDYPVKLVLDGQYFVEGDEVHAYGTDGDDSFESNWGRAVFLGGDGDDTYSFTTGNLRGNQTIVDSDGNGSIVVDGIDIGAVAKSRVSDSVWVSDDGAFRFVVVEVSGAEYLVVESVGSGSKLVVNDWENGGLGISLTGDVPVNAGGGLSGGDDLFGQAGTNDGGDVVNGLAGNDGLEGGAGDDYLDGGAGSDLILGGSGDDRLYGGDGGDFIYDGSEQANLREWDDTPDPDTGKSELDEFNERLVSLGSAVLVHGASWYVADVVYAPSWTNYDPNVRPSGDDVIDAGAGNDRALAGEGNDTLLGGVGNDYLGGGFDHDIILGGDGDDRVDGDYPSAESSGIYLTWQGSDNAQVNGNDVIDGGAGSDHLQGNGGDDVIYGGDDDDVLFGRGMLDAADEDDLDMDQIDGGAGNDTIIGDDGNDLLVGGDGRDIIRGDNAQAGTRHGNDTIDAGSGDDEVAGDGGDDVIDGGAGADVLRGDEANVDGNLHGRDIVHGGANNDVINGGGGNDVLYGDDGDDQIIGDQASNESLAAQYHGNDTIYGGAGNDLLSGNGGNDILDGGEGDDELQGGDGDDRLDGGIHNDTLHGEAGNDVLNGGDGDDELYAGTGDDRLSGGTGLDTLAGGDGNDVLHGDDGNDILDGEAGNDRIFGGAGDDTIDGDDGDDVVYAGLGNDGIYGGLGNDVINAEDGNDIVTAAEGDDEVYGGAGNDNLQGDAGNDALYGDDGDDHLIGGEGNDLLVGGAGLNHYYFDRQFGQDVVQLTAGSQDQIYLREGITSAELQFAREDDDLVLSMADGSTLRLTNYFTAVVEALTVFVEGAAVSGTLTKQNLLDGPYFTVALVGTESADTLQGTVDGDRMYSGAGNDTLNGLASDDLLDGGAGDDTLSGDGGNDVLVGGAGNDTYLINANGGFDTILGLDASNAGSDVILIGGTILPNSVRVSISGDDVMLSFDTSAAPSGILDSVYLTGFMQGNHAILLSNGTVWTRASFTSQTLPAVNGTAGGDVMTGSDANDVLNGLGGDDILRGEGGNDVLNGGTGTDLLYGGMGNDTLRGDAYDTLYGGLGDDTYYLDDTSLVVEYAGEGYDQAYGTNSFTLPYNVEKAIASGAGIRNVVGNTSDNLIVFNTSGSYVNEGSIDGREGADRYEYNSGMFTRYLTIYADNDGDSWSSMESSAQFDLVFSAKRDLIFDSSLRSVTLAGATNASVTGDGRGQKIDGAGSSGANRLEGQGGDDEYRIDVNDTVVESADGGTDVVTVIGNAIQSYQVAEGSNIEKFMGGGGLGSLIGSSGDDVLAIDGFSATKLFGGQGNDSLTGSAGVDYLDGGTGGDVMIGMAGNDTYYVDSAGDSIIDTGGASDTLYVSVDAYICPAGIESVYLTGSAISAIGTANTDRLLGNELDNVLDGKGGYRDQLDGATGADRYVFQRGYGIVSIPDSGSDGAIDVLDLGPGILRSDISVYEDVQSWGTNYEISIAGGTGTYPDIITVTSNSAGQASVEQVRLADGSTWTIDELMGANTLRTPTMVTGGTHHPILVARPSASVVTGADLVPSLQRWSRWEDDLLWDRSFYVDHRWEPGAGEWPDTPTLYRDPTPDARQLDGLISAMAAFSAHGDLGVSGAVPQEHTHSLLYAVQLA